MGLRQCVRGARPTPRAFHPRVLTEEPQRVDSLLGEQPQLAPLTTDLAPSSIQSKQELLGPVRELTWKFPEEPVQLDFKGQDFFSTGQLLEPSLLSLGGCGVVNSDAAARVLIFQLLVLSIFTLDYRPAELQSTSIVRSSGATVGIECHYPSSGSSNERQPAWIPYVSTKVAEDTLVFSLKIMTGLPSNVFFLGEVLNILASVKQYNHVPLRIFVDHCVATTGSNVNSAPIWFTDANYTGSMSNFLPRVQDDKLQFQLAAFRFHKENSGAVCICAVPAGKLNQHLHKACQQKEA
uniref:Zona pellucida sperm-binding protein 3 n=1 Tax=Sinocyclocheilus grahami TaxID=75366 RepID=A0A672P6U5_SINGR